MEISKSIQSTIIRLGLMLGLTRIGLALGGGMIMSPTEMSQSIAYLAISMAVALVFMIYGGFQIRKEQGDRLTFQQGFIICFGVFALSSLIAAVFNLWYLRNWLGEAAMQDPLLASMATPQGMVQNLLSNLIIGGGISMILGFGLKRSHPRAEVK